MPAGGMPVWALDTPPGKRFFRVDCRLPPRVATGGFFIRKKPPVILLSARIKLLIIVRPDLEPCLRLFADRADLGRLGALMNMPAVETDPGRLLGLFEHGLPFDVGKEGIIPFHMLLFDFRNQLKQDRNIIESFFPGLLRKIGIHLLPLVLLPGRCILEVFGGGRHLAVVENPEPDFRMFLFIVCGLIEDVANLLVTVLPRFRCEIGVLVARLRFAGKRRL